MRSDADDSVDSADAVFRMTLKCALAESGKSRFWLLSSVAMPLDLRPTGREFDYRPPHCRAATLDQSFTHVAGASEALYDLIRLALPCRGLCALSGGLLI